LATSFATVTALVAFGIWVWVRTPEEPRIETDAELMQQTTGHLREIEADLRGLPAPAGAFDKGTRQVGCETDSGDVLQPAAVRHWRVSASDVRQATDALAEALRAQGWTGSTFPNQFGSYYLTADRGIWSAQAVIGGASDGDPVYAEVTIKDALPCRLAPE
jgi:hypothetical protein